MWKGVSLAGNLNLNCFVLIVNGENKGLSPCSSVFGGPIGILNMKKMSSFGGQRVLSHSIRTQSNTQWALLAVGSLLMMWTLPEAVADGRRAIVCPRRLLGYILFFLIGGSPSARRRQLLFIIMFPSSPPRNRTFKFMAIIGNTCVRIPVVTNTLFNLNKYLWERHEDFGDFNCLPVFY